MSKIYRKFFVGSVLLLALSGAAPAAAAEESETALAPFGNAVVSGSAGVTGL